MVNASRRRSASGASDAEDDGSGAGPSPAKRVKLERISLPVRPAVTSQTDSEPQGTDEEEDDAETEDEVEEEEEVVLPTAAEAMTMYKAERQKRREEMGGSSEAGVIKSLHLVDFMCHRHFSIDFGAKMNFLVGHNGSGKSAVLTAVAIALGGKAAATGRGTGLKDLIHKEADRAIITLTLSNQGYNAFRPKDREYNPNIVIERIINKNGSSEWRFRATKDGKILARKKSELDNIRTTFCIDVDQPLTILTQDQARSFLQNAGDMQLYKFFMKGSMLEDMSDAYDSAKNKMDTLQRTTTQLKESLPDRKAKAAELKRRIEANDLLVQKQRSITELKREQAWSLVIEKEKARKQYQDEADVQDVKLRELVDLMDGLTAEMVTVDAEIESQTAAITAFMESKQPIEASRRAMKLKYEGLKKMVQELKENIASEKQKVVEADREMARHDRAIADKGELMNSGRDEAHRKLQEDLRKHEAVEDNLKRDLPKKEEALEQAARVRNQADAELEASRGKVRELNEESERYKGTLAGLERQSSNRLAAFGNNIELVLSEIDRARWHACKPYGPLGRYVELKDFQFKGLVEALIGGLMCAFAVQDSRDRIQLIKILEDCLRPGHLPQNMRPQIPTVIVNSGDIFDYSSGDQSLYHPTVLSKLNITDEYVKRIFLNQANIERNFITWDSDVASAEVDRLLRSGLRHVTIFSAHPSLYKQEGSPGSKNAAPVPEFRGNRMFTRDLAEEARHVREQLEKAKDELRREEQHCEDLRNTRDKRQHEWSGIQAALEKARKSLPSFAAKIEAMRNTLAERPSDEITALEQIKDDTNREKMSVLRNLDTLVMEEADLKAKLQEAKTEFDGLATRVENFVPERKALQERLETLTMARQQKKVNLAHYESSKVTSEKKRNDLMGKYERADAQAKEWTEKILPSYPERFNTERDTKTIRAEEEMILKAIADIEKRQGINIDMIKEQYIKCANEVREAGAQIRDLTTLHKMVEVRLAQRSQWYATMRSMYAIKAIGCFVANIEARGFDGTLRFDHAQQTLTMGIRTNGQSQDPMVRKLVKTAKHLSGGERSFATVSFLLAMWETAGGPLRCLDEWDVFLDPVNRGIAAQLLIDGAKQAVGKQYILITPQSMAGVTIEGADSKIIRMPNPIRNQGTLQFQAA